MALSVKVILIKRKLQADGKAPLALRVIKDRKIKYKWLNYKIEPKYFDEKQQRAKSSYPNAANLNFLIKKKLYEVERYTINIETNHGDVMADQIISSLERKSSGKSFNEYALYLTDRFYKSKQFGPSKRYKSTVNIQSIFTFLYLLFIRDII